MKKEKKNECYEKGNFATCPSDKSCSEVQKNKTIKSSMKF